MHEFMTVIKALADENRVRVILALHERESCVCQIIDLLGLAPSTVSNHMPILKQARLVNSRKDGRWVYYSLAANDAPVEAREVVAWVCKCLTNDSKVQVDTARLIEIMKFYKAGKCNE